MTAPYSLDLGWQYAPGAQPVTLFRRQPGGGFDAGTIVAHAVAPPLARTVEGDDRTLARRQTWWLCPAESDAGGALPPKVDDVIQDGTGARWEIDKVTAYPLGSGYECQASQEV